MRGCGTQGLWVFFSLLLLLVSFPLRTSPHYQHALVGGFRFRQTRLSRFSLISGLPSRPERSRKDGRAAIHTSRRKRNYNNNKKKRLQKQQTNHPVPGPSIHLLAAPGKRKSNDTSEDENLTGKRGKSKRRALTRIGSGRLECFSGSCRKLPRRSAPEPGPAGFTSFPRRFGGPLIKRLILQLLFISALWWPFIGNG